MSCVLRKARNF